MTINIINKDLNNKYCIIKYYTKYYYNISTNYMYDKIEEKIDIIEIFDLKDLIINIKNGIYSQKLS